MKNLEKAFAWVFENSTPISKRESDELSKTFNYKFKEGSKVIKAYWFISNTLICLSENEIDDFCKSHNLIYLNKFTKIIYVYGKKSKLSLNEIDTLKKAVKKYSEDETWNI